MRDEGTVAARERPARSDSLPEGQIPVRYLITTSNEVVFVFLRRESTLKYGEKGLTSHGFFCIMQGKVPRKFHTNLRTVREGI
jgi:hypothetical protein